MKQIMTISAALLFLTIGEVQAQNGIEQVLKNIETNNKELQANEQLITSQNFEAKTDNNLPDPTRSYAQDVYKRQSYSSRRGIFPWKSNGRYERRQRHSASHYFFKEYRRW